MKNSIRSLAVSAFSALLVLTPVGAKALDSDGKPLIFAAAQSSKQKQVNACRARYRGCVKLNQIPSFECQYIYQDCIKHIY